MKVLSNSDKIKELILPKMTDLIIFIDNNRKYDVYIEVNIHGIYHYLEIIGPPTTFTNSGHGSHNFDPSSSINNDAETTQTVIAAVCMRQKSIFKCCGNIGHKASSCTIRVHKLLQRQHEPHVLVQGIVSTFRTGFVHIPRCVTCRCAAQSLWKSKRIHIP